MAATSSTSSARATRSSASMPTPAPSPISAPSPPPSPPPCPPPTSAPSPSSPRPSRKPPLDGHQQRRASLRPRRRPLRVPPPRLLAPPHPGGLFFCRLASTIGMEDVWSPSPAAASASPTAPSATSSTSHPRTLTAALGGYLIDPLKTTVVQNQRCMTTWVVGKDYRGASDRRHRSPADIHAAGTADEQRVDQIQEQPVLDPHLRPNVVSKMTLPYRCDSRRRRWRRNPRPPPPPSPQQRAAPGLDAPQLRLDLVGASPRLSGPSFVTVVSCHLFVCRTSVDVRRL